MYFYPSSSILKHKDSILKHLAFFNPIKSFLWGITFKIQKKSLPLHTRTKKINDQVKNITK